MSSLNRSRRHSLASCIATAFALIAFAPACFAAYDNVLNCNDTGAGSLRDTIASATSGDTIVLNPVTMQCSSITLGGAEIGIKQQYLTIKYNGDNANQFTISGGGLSRVFSMYSFGGRLTLQRLHVMNGSTSGNGGCIITNSDVSLNYSSISGCISKSTTGFMVGGGAVVLGTLTLNHSVVSGNSVESMQSSALGGGAYANLINASYSIVNGNTAKAGSNGLARGGGVFVFNRSNTYSTFSNSTVSGNSADIGGGAYLTGSCCPQKGAPVSILNSTISGNSAGIATAAYINGTTSLRSSTIAFNMGSGSAALLFATPGYTVDFESSIISNNTVPAVGVKNFSSTLHISGANNLVDSLGIAVTLPSDTIGSDPLLLPLTNNGGSTQTHAFRDGSPAFGHGNNNSNLGTDQRGSGFARTVNGATDIGAFQQQVRDVIFANGFD